MPEKSLTVATYAAGASLAAITLIYVFGPTYFLDSDPSGSGHPLASGSARRKGVVGLANPANDCFINSVLQALAGLGDLRLYLIRELHRRAIDDQWVYAQAVPVGADPASAAGAGGKKQMPTWKVEGLQAGLVTKGLKDMLDQLNERPIYKKTITAVPFVRTLETAFRQRISRQQQDAQEFLQIVAERLCDEYHAGRRARRYARRRAGLGRLPADGQGVDSEMVEERLARLDLQNGARAPPNPDARPEVPAIQRTGVDDAGDEEDENENEDEDEDEDEEGFPMEGRVESQIECLTCGFKPRPTESTFCTLTLNVPQVSSTSLGACFDGLFKTEYIDDFKCEKCRLLHARGVLEAEMQRSNSDAFKAQVRDSIARLQVAIDTDPENPPPDVVLPDRKYAPKRKIAKHARVTSFPKILAIHLSRSIYDATQASLKNSAKVAFPEALPLGGLLQQNRYKLLGLVTHKGSHHSGHYESFRRQNFYPPFSNPTTFQPSGVYSKAATPVSTPRIGSTQHPSRSVSPAASTPDLSAAGVKTGSSSSPSLDSVSTSNLSPHHSPSLNGRPPSSSRCGPTSAPREAADKERDAETSSLRSAAASARSRLSRITPSRSGSRSGGGRHGGGPLAPASSAHTRDAATRPPAAAAASASAAAKSRRRKHHDRWWRISDEKIKEASTRDVLGMQREVYLLFYELERDEV